MGGLILSYGTPSSTTHVDVFGTGIFAEKRPGAVEKGSMEIRNIYILHRICKNYASALKCLSLL